MTVLTDRLTLDIPEWSRHAACATGQYPPDLWFPGVGHNSRATKALAIAVCAQCPVRTECEAASIDPMEPAGIWAGLGPHQRRKLAEPKPATHVRNNQAIVTAYTTGTSGATLRTRYGIHTRTLHHILETAGVQVRTAAEARALQSAQHRRAS